MLFQCVCCPMEICILYNPLIVFLCQPCWQSFVLTMSVGTKRCKRACLYYANSTASFHLLLIGDLVFKLNPGPDFAGNCYVKPIVSVRASRASLPILQGINNNLIKINCLPAIRNVEHQLSICLFNACSVRSKTADIMDYIFDTKADIIAITETWLTLDDDAVKAELCPIGYRLLDQPRTGQRGGGTVLLFRDSLFTVKKSAGEMESFEYSD